MVSFISVISQGHCRIVERFGKPVRVQRSGLAFTWPWPIERHRDAPENWYDEIHDPTDRTLIELTEQIRDPGEREYFSRDNVKLLANCVYRWRIVDPIKAVYDVDNLPKSIEETVLNSMRSEIGSRTLDVILSSRKDLNEKVLSAVSTTLLRWGIQLTSIELQEVRTDDATASAMLQQMDAERKSRAMASQAEGEAKAITTRAEAEKQAAILKAEGVSESLKMIAEAESNYLLTLSKTVGESDAAKILIAQKTLDGFSTISKNPSDKVFIPSNINAFLSIQESKVNNK